jgi:hypothetical protein
MLLLLQSEHRRGTLARRADISAGIGVPRTDDPIEGRADLQVFQRLGNFIVGSLQRFQLRIVRFLFGIGLVDIILRDRAGRLRRLYHPVIAGLVRNIDRLLGLLPR